VLADKQGRDGAVHPNHCTVNRLEITLIGEFLRFAWVVGLPRKLEIRKPQETCHQTGFLPKSRHSNLKLFFETW